MFFFIITFGDGDIGHGQWTGRRAPKAQRYLSKHYFIRGQSQVEQCSGSISSRQGTLNDAEQNYSQIEKEVLVIIFFCEEIPSLYFWQEVRALYTDYKPLLSIFDNKKGIPIYTANRRSVLTQLHRIEGIKIHSRSYVYWPKIGDITTTGNVADPY